MAIKLLYYDDFTLGTAGQSLDSRTPLYTYNGQGYDVIALPQNGATTLDQMCGYENYTFATNHSQVFLDMKNGALTNGSRLSIDVPVGAVRPGYGYGWYLEGVRDMGTNYNDAAFYFDIGIRDNVTGMYVRTFCNQGMTQFGAAASDLINTDQTINSSIAYDTGGMWFIQKGLFDWNSVHGTLSYMCSNGARNVYDITTPVTTTSILSNLRSQTDIATRLILTNTSASATGPKSGVLRAAIYETPIDNYPL